MFIATSMNTNHVWSMIIDIAMNIDRQWSLIMSIITHDQWSLPWNAVDHTWSVLINGLYRDPYTLVVTNGWNDMERVTGHSGWGLAQLGVCLCGGCPKFWPRSAQKGPTLSKNGQKWPKYDFEHSGGPKRLEWHGTSYRTSWLRFWHNWGCVYAVCVPYFGQGYPKWPK